MSRLSVFNGFNGVSTDAEVFCTFEEGTFITLPLSRFEIFELLGVADRTEFRLFFELVLF
jgi:hypothetical protein